MFIHDVAARHSCLFHPVMDSDFTSDKDVEMDNRTQRASILFGSFVFLVWNVGCAALPWRANKPAETMTAEQYAQQVVEGISYDNSVDFSKNYQPSVATESRNTSPPKGYSAASSSSSGSCCSH